MLRSQALKDADVGVAESDNWSQSGWTSRGLDLLRTHRKNRLKVTGVKNLGATSHGMMQSVFSDVCGLMPLDENINIVSIKLLLNL